MTLTFRNYRSSEETHRTARHQAALQGIFFQELTPLEELAFLVFAAAYDDLPDDAQTYLVAWCLTLVPPNHTPAATTFSRGTSLFTGRRAVRGLGD